MVGRHIDYGNIDVRYDENKMMTDYHDRSKAIEAWNELKQRGVEMHFATIKGYKRYYSIEHRNGGMLEVYPDEYSHNPEVTGVVNGTLFTNIPDEVYETVSTSESQYESVEVGLDEFEYPYTEPDDKIGDTTIYVAESGRNKQVRRHPVYHDGILRAYVYLLRDENEVPNKVVKEHLLSYIKNTYEYDGDEWRTLYDLDGDKDVERVVNVVKQDLEIY